MRADDVNYHDVSYWENRFKEENEFEWLAELNEFKEHVLPLLSPAMRVLHIGCGTSKLSPTLYKMGFQNITNIDYSTTLIERMANLYPEMAWICDDIRSLSKLENEQFDVVIEKATIECLLDGEQSQWNLSEKACEEIVGVFNSIQRVLKHGGYFISISFTQPHFRVPLLLRVPNWSCDVSHFGDFFHYYVYRMKKGASPDWHSLEHYLKITVPPGNESDWKNNIVEDTVSLLEVFANSFPDLS